MAYSKNLQTLMDYYQSQKELASVIEQKVFDIAEARLCNGGVTMTLDFDAVKSDDLRRLYSAKRISRDLAWNIRYGADLRLKSAQRAYEVAIKQMQSINGVVLREVIALPLEQVERAVHYAGLGWDRLTNMLASAVIGTGSDCGRFIRVQTTDGVYLVQDGAHNIYSMIEDV